IRIKQPERGIDFLFGNRSHAVKSVEFVQKVVPINSRSEKQLVPFTSILTSKQLVEYVVLDVDPISTEVNIGGSRYVMTDVQVAGRTHLGHLLNVGILCSWL
ncbi:60S ribosomal export protein NMD3, partial [Tanacetum coccineum]